jgi:hypothetical protein
MLGLIFFLVRFTVAIESLTIATRASLNIAALNVKLAFDCAAVMTWPLVSPPVIRLIPVTDAGDLLTIDDAGLHLLRLSNLFRPVGRHGYPAINNLLWRFGHDEFSNEA